MERYRIIVIGAGFSVHAGMPLGSELFDLIRANVRDESGSDNKLESDLSRYLKYREKCDCIDKDVLVDYEKFMSFLDMEHYLGLKGKDTWSEEGNESQLMIKRGILQVLFERLPRRPTEECIAFCEKLTPSDTIITFNYDTLIEDTLDHLGISYRLFPCRYKELGLMSATVDSDTDENEIPIFKLHGSIDWFDKVPYMHERELASKSNPPWESRHPIFKAGSGIGVTPLTNGPRYEDDPLRHIYRVNNLADVVGKPFWQCTPLILSPSSSKILYANPLRGLWNGLQQTGGLNLGFGVIGYSLPDYDEYARQALYHMFSNYTDFEPDLELGGVAKGIAKILDFFPPGDPGWKIRKQYSFVNWYRCELNGDGVTMDGIEWFFCDD